MSRFHSTRLAAVFSDVRSSAKPGGDLRVSEEPSIYKEFIHRNHGSRPVGKVFFPQRKKDLSAPQDLNRKLVIDTKMCPPQFPAATLHHLLLLVVVKLGYNRSRTLVVGPSSSEPVHPLERDLLHLLLGEFQVGFHEAFHRRLRVFSCLLWNPRDHQIVPHAPRLKIQEGFLDRTVLLRKASGVTAQGFDTFSEGLILRCELLHLLLAELQRLSQALELSMEDLQQIQAAVKAGELFINGI
ncbi:uncharacterized protein LOC111948849 [Oryzias latipes]